MVTFLTSARSRISLFLHSIRFRLSLWFGLVLAVILLIFSLFVYYLQSQYAYDQAASRLAVRIAELDRAFIRAFRYNGENAWLTVPGTSTGDAFMLREGEVIVLVNPYGQVATFSGPVSQSEAKALAAIAKNKEPDSRLSIYQLQSNQSTETATYLFISAPVGYNDHLLGWVTLGQQMDPDNQLSRLRWTLLLTGTVTLIAALAGGYWLANRALSPVKTITRTAQAISETGLNRRIDISTQDELGELASTFNQMLNRLQAAFERQRQFTADASHELRTPLAIIGLETGRVLDGSYTVQDYRQALEVIDSENGFMARLVEELLTLARMDAAQFQLKTEPLDLSDVVLEAVERYEPIAARKGLSIHTGDLPELPVQGDRQYLLQMVSNLVDNAIKYTPEGASQPVEVSAGQRQGLPYPAAFIQVSDHGIGIAGEHLPHLFNRFYRVDTARSHNLDEKTAADGIPGSGLGLSIVQQIVELHGGSIQVRSLPAQGTTFEVTLPLLATL